MLDSEALDAESLPAIPLEAVLLEPAIEAVLQDFMKTFEGGLTDHDTAGDNDNIPLVIEADHHDDELDMKLYKNEDRLSPLHLSCCLATYLTAQAAS